VSRLDGKTQAQRAPRLAPLLCCLVITCVGAAATGARQGGSRLPATRAIHAAPPSFAMSPAPSVVGARGLFDRRTACSPREPFTPPVVARLRPAGVVVLDDKRGTAIVVSSLTTARATTLAVAAYDVTTGRLIRSRRIVSAPVAPASATTILDDALSAVGDDATGRVFVLHAPFTPGRNLPGRVDVLDPRTLTVTRRVRVGGLPRPPVIAGHGERVFVASQRDGAVTTLDARDGRLLRVVNIAPPPLGPTAAPVVDDRTGRVFVAPDTRDGHMVVLDARSGALLRRVAVGAFPRVIGVDRGAGRVLVAGDGRVDALDARDGRLVRTAPLAGSPRRLLIDEAGRRAFVSYSDNVNVSMLDTATGTTLRTTPVRLDQAVAGQLPAPDQGEIGTYPLLQRVDERRRWVVVRVPPVLSDDGPEQGPAQIAVLDSRTATRIHTVFSEPVWPDAVAVDDRRGRAFSDIGGAINVYDISCLRSYYIFGDLG